MDKRHALLLLAMAEHDQGDPHRIQHFTKVHDLAAAIGTLEGLDDETLFVLETAAIVHDIGIRPALARYGSSAGPYQEFEGPPVAEAMLRRLGTYTEAEIERVKYLVGHHHTYKSIDGIDYQILVEADFLVNLYEHKDSYDSVQNVKKNIFRTETGLKLLNVMFAEPDA